MKLYAVLHELIGRGAVVSAYALDGKGLAAAVSKMAFGNKLGMTIEKEVSEETLFAPGFGNIVAEVPVEKVGIVGETLKAAGLSGNEELVGWVNEEQSFCYGGMKLALDEAIAAWSGTLEKVFPTRVTDNKDELDTGIYRADSIYVCKHKVAKPTVFIPVFPGTNCEYDSARAFERAGADTIVKVFKNRMQRTSAIRLRSSQRRSIGHRLSCSRADSPQGDEPEGSAKFFATAFRNAKMTEAVMKLLNERDGLALGICNGFQALIKLGLVPYGEIRPQTADSPTLTYNTIGRHISKMVYTKVVTNKSPWLAQAKTGEVYCNPASHGEGRLSLRRNGWRSCLQTVRWQHSMSTRRVFRPWMRSGMSTAPTWQSRESQAGRKSARQDGTFGAS